MIARASAARVAADLASLALGVVAAVITARWLGAEGKGLQATLSLLAFLVGRASGLGLGDAAVHLIGQRSVRAETAWASTARVSVVLGLTGSVLMLGLGWILAQPTGDEVWALAVAAATVPLAVLADLSAHVLWPQQKMVRASAIYFGASACSLTALVVFVIAADLGLTGAMLAGTAAAVWTIAASAYSGKDDIRLRASVDRSFTRAAVSYGVRLELSYLMSAMTARVDLILVFGIAGANSAGLYSIALTAANLTTVAPFALSYASFPVLAADERAAGTERLLAMGRSALILGLATALLVAATAPILFPFAFGSEFADAAGPTAILAGGAVLWGLQMLLARGMAAQGSPNTLLASCALALGLMLVGDVILIPPLGLTGAALAAVVGPIGGLAYVLRDGRDAGLTVRNLVPKTHDLRFLWAQALRLRIAQKP